ncbi:unnamed protein product [Blepharisma stoltei]|uniref:Uncharacterized protein n=1 Tax=Blepharisma stoltei TaxID=1481888 RepID=A0AAU9JCX5_9CILI|nr:unnamed protein product [Blepharisma stoltei]
MKKKLFQSKVKVPKKEFYSPPSLIERLAIVRSRMGVKKKFFGKKNLYIKIKYFFILLLNKRVKVFNNYFYSKKLNYFHKIPIFNIWFISYPFKLYKFNLFLIELNFFFLKF